MEQRPHANPVLVAKGHMQYRWFRSNLKEQEVVKKEKINLNAHIVVEHGKELDACVGHVVESGDNRFQPKMIARKVPKAKEEDTQIDPKLKAKMD